MTDEVVLTKEEFVEWREHPITKHLLMHLRLVREATVESMTNEQVIMGDQCQRIMARSLGVLTGLDAVLNMETDLFDDISEFE